MSKKKSKSKQPELKPFSDKKQKRYERIAHLEYGLENVNESVRRWASYSKAEQAAIMAEDGSNYTALTGALRAGKLVHDAEVQALVHRWYEHINCFYEPTLEIARGLGQLYTTDPTLATTIYIDAPATAALARLLADEAGDHRVGCSSPALIFTPLRSALIFNLSHLTFSTLSTSSIKTHLMSIY